MLDFSRGMTEEQMEDARRKWLPRLCDFARECRRERPLPTFDGLSAAQREQYRMLRAKMESFRPRSFSEKHVAILYSTAVGLLAARDALATSKTV